MLSVIVPLYNEEKNVPVLVSSIREALVAEDLLYEVILVDDASKDRTFEAVRQESANDDRIKGVRFTRHYGKTAAITAGIKYAQGEICITMDGDLQHDPRQISGFLKQIDDGYDLVCSYRIHRKDAFLRRFPSRVANYIARKFSKLAVRDFGSGYWACRTSLAKRIPIYGEMHRFIPVFVSMETDRITEIPISLHPRLHGRSKYGLGRTFRVFSDLLLLLFFASFFSRPIHIFGYISVLLGLPGFIILSWLSLAKLFGHILIIDYGPMFVLGVMLCLVAVQVFTTGIVCEYLIRIYYSGSARPYRIAETTFENPSL